MEEENKKKGCARCCEWFRSPTAAIYATYMMSSWGDRMWQFAVGLYLVFFEDGVLLLAAALNFCSSGTVLLFGGLLGNWVDHNPRLKVVRVSLVIQNTGVILSALCVCVLLHYNEELHGSSRHLVEAAIIFLAVIANLASVAYKISVEKDWIVVVSEGNSSALARARGVSLSVHAGIPHPLDQMPPRPDTPQDQTPPWCEDNLNAVTRSLDLCSKVMAPALCGLIMSVASLMAGALFIAGWNVVSVVVEYLLLQRVYTLVPRLAYKEGVSDPQDAPMKEMTELNAKALLDESNEKPNLNETSDATDAAIDNSVSAKDANNVTDGALLSVKEKCPDEDEGKKKKAKKSCVRTMFDPFITLVRGWHVYARQSVVFAGVSLSCLFMTVLALDSVSVGYLYALGLSELALGLAMAACGVTGIIATFLFTRIRKCMGLERTGVLAFSLEISCLVLCLVSVWAPGSPFDPNYLQNRSDTKAEESQKQNCELSSLNSTLCMFNSPMAKDANWTLDALVKDTAQALLGDSTSSPGNSTEPAVDKTSAILFVVGVITSRVGLWMADLTVTQLLQENVQEKERGMVNGVQSSLNMLLYLFITLMVFVLPYIETFGILIIVSFCGITTGGLFFLAHACKVHRTHVHQGRGCCGTCCYSDSIDTTVAAAVTKA